MADVWLGDSKFSSVSLNSYYFFNKILNNSTDKIKQNYYSKFSGVNFKIIGQLAMILESVSCFRWQCLDPFIKSISLTFTFWLWPWVSVLCLTLI